MTNIARLPVAPVDIDPETDAGDLPAGWSWRAQPHRDTRAHSVYSIHYGDRVVAYLSLANSGPYIDIEGPAPILPPVPVMGAEIAEKVARLLADVAGGEA